MKKTATTATTIRRRDFVKCSVAAISAASLGVGMLTLTERLFSAQGAASQPVPWWAAKPNAGRVGKPEAIDMHAHWTPESYNKALGDLGQPVNNPFPLNYDLNQRLQWMDEHGDLMHCLTLPNSPWQRFTAQQSARLSQIVNDAGIEAHRKYPDRFVIAIELPVRDGALALKELNRVAGQPGVRAVHIPDSIERGDYLFDSSFAPVLARIEELKYPIIFHQIGGEPNNFGGRRSLGPPDLTSAIDAPAEHTLLASKLIYTGTLDKYPNLQIVLPHAGGAFPYLAGRVEHFLFHMNDHSTSIQRPFRDYLRRFHYDYLTYYPETFHFLMGLVGSDRVVVGTDHFAARDIDYPTSVVDQLKLPAVDRERILQGNARRILHL
jgi:aminocarboxymuconate-semialdehyde decarboxylase